MSSYIEQALEQVGSRGRYQIIMLGYFTLIWLQITWMLLGSGFVFMNPVFNCPSQPGDLTEAQACPILLHSSCTIVNDFTITAYAKLYCDRQSERNIIQSTLYIGSIVGLFIMNPLSDIKGRRFVFLISQGVSILGVTCTSDRAYLKSTGLLAFAQVLIGFGAYSTMLMGYMFISDFCDNQLRQYGILCMNAVWALAQTFLGLFFYVYNLWQNFLIIIILIPSVGLFLFSLFFILETPSFLMSKLNDKEGAMKSLEIIAMYNKTEGNLANARRLMQKEYDKNGGQQKVPSKLAVLREMKYLKVILLVATVELGVNAFYYGVQFSLAEVGTNFGNNILITGFIEAVAFFTANLFITRLKRRWGLWVFNIISIVIGLAYLLPFVKDSPLVSTIVLGLCRFVNAYAQAIIPLLQVQSFPLKYQSSGWGFIQGISQIGNFISPYLVSGAINAGINPILVFCVLLTILGILPLKFTRETIIPLKSSTHGEPLLSVDSEHINDTIQN